MFEDTVTDCTVGETLAAAARSRAAADAHEARILELAAHYGDLHAVTESDIIGHVVPGMERLIRLGGAGTPEVAEFAPAEFGAALGLSASAGAALIGEALELRHRLPTLWALVHDAKLQAWKARWIAAKSLSLSEKAIAFVDTHIGPVAASIGPVRLANLIEAAKIHTDPVQAAADADAVRRRRGVWVGRSDDCGHKTITIKTDAGDVIRFDATVDQVADILGRLGDTDTKEVRRAKAIGILASPAATLALFHDDQAVRAGADPADLAQRNPFQDPDQDPGQGPGGGTVIRRSDLLPPVTLYLHLSEDSFTRDTDGVARFEGAGPISTEQAIDILRHANVTIRPVIDIESRASVDAYEIPTRIGKAVLLKNPCCIAPFCNHTGPRKDKDHIVAYVPPDDGGPPGQTTIDNLGATCRRDHRRKTHGHWDVEQPFNGIYVWRSPHGQIYIVDHTGTQRLTNIA